MSKLEPLVQFGRWRYRASVGKLWPADADESVAALLEPRLQKLLNYFLLHPNQLLTKNQLIEDVWPAGEGTDGAVMRAVGALRKLLQDNTQAPVFIATIPKKGYCWLAELEPLTTPQAEQNRQFEHDNSAQIRRVGLQRYPNRQFILLAVLSLLISCGIVAYGLTHLTLGAAQQSFHHLEPISALNGRERLPLWDSSQQQMFYQHQRNGQSEWQWVAQPSQQVSPVFLPGSYKALGPASFADNNLYFSAQTEEGCGIFQQAVTLPPLPARQLAVCRQWQPSGMTLLGEHLYWLDTVPDRQAQFQLWRATVPVGHAPLQPEAVPMEAIAALAIHRLIAHEGSLYLLVQVSFSQAQLIRMHSGEKDWQLMKQYPQVVIELAESRKGLWLSQSQQPYQPFTPMGNNAASLGPLSVGLRDLIFIGPAEPVAVSGAKPIDDLWFATKAADGLGWQHWYPSNRTERLAAVSGTQVAFVSNRSGNEQIWLAQRGHLQQVTSLAGHQQIQQLLWFRQHLLAVINRKVFQLNTETGQLQALLPPEVEPSQLEVCRQQLYWTQFDGKAGWQLYRMAANRAELVLDDVLDVRCAPDGLVIRRDRVAGLQLWRQDGRFLSLSLPGFSVPAVERHQWLTNDLGIAWLDTAVGTLSFMSWQDAYQQFELPAGQAPTAIYSDRSGSQWLLQQSRQQDSDVVRLLPDRTP